MQVETARLILRPTTEADAREIHAGRRPARLAFADGYPTPMALEVMDIFVGSRIADAHGFHPFFMHLKPGEEIIGDIGYSVAEGSSVATVGYGISPASEGQGYTTEALAGLIDYLFTFPGIDAVEADTFVGHGASRRVMEKAGMVFLEERDGEEGGEPMRLVVYQARRGAV